MGTQYRSVIFYHDLHQRSVAEQIICQLEENEAYDAPLVTDITPFEKFYPAEDYHQDYFNKNPENKYCQRVVKPKLEKFIQVYKDLIDFSPKNE